MGLPRDVLLDGSGLGFAYPSQSLGARISTI